MRAGTYLGFLPDGLVNDIVVLNDLFLDGELKVLETGILLLQINIAQTSIEKDLAGVELEKETELRVVDHRVASQVE